jgi:hypothetical protein
VSSKPILSIVAAFAVSAAGSSLARADDDTASKPADAQAGSQTEKPKKAKKTKKHPNKTELDKLERGNPHSTIYKSRKKSAPNPTAEQIQAGESGNPHSVGSGDRKTGTQNPTNEQIQAGEKGNPDAVQPSPGR